MTGHAFVTGGTGFLGARIIAQLIEQGWKVTALHRPQTGPDRLLALGARPAAAPLDDLDLLRAAMPENPDAVFHVAGNTSMWRRHRDHQYRDNVLGTATMVNIAREKNARRFIHTSSISAWGIQPGPITEETPSRAQRDWIRYNRTKFLAEEEVRRGIDQGMDAVILNPCGIIGPGDTHNWSQMISLIDRNRLPGVPPGSGSFCHVDEVARAHLTALDRGRTGANYILAGVEASFLELAQTIAGLLGRKPPQRTVPAPVLRLAGYLYPLFSLFSDREPDLTPEKVALVTGRVHAVDDRAVEELGFRNDIPLKTMLEDCIDWMREEGMLRSA